MIPEGVLTPDGAIQQERQIGKGPVEDIVVVTEKIILGGEKLFKVAPFP